MFTVIEQTLIFSLRKLDAWSVNPLTFLPSFCLFDESIDSCRLVARYILRNRLNNDSSIDLAVVVSTVRFRDEREGTFSVATSELCVAMVSISH